VSIVVPTRDRPDFISTCLHALTHLHYPRYEILIVDNAPTTSATAEYIQRNYAADPRVRYIREDHPGISHARNCGMMAAKGEIIAFTDDDVVVDAYWLAELVRGFQRTKNVACVTGYVLPLELNTPAQLWFEDAGWLEEENAHQLFTRRVFGKETRYLHLYRGGLFGRGANMATTTTFLRSIGGFDPALGTGTLTKGGEDLDLFLQVSVAGYDLVYEPAALIHHLHRRDYAALRKQMYGYGVGFTAYLAKSVLTNPRLLLDFVTKVPYDMLGILWARIAKRAAEPTRKAGAQLKTIQKSTYYPKDLTTLQVKGFLIGPIAYLRSLWRKRQLERSLHSSSDTLKEHPSAPPAPRVLVSQYDSRAHAHEK
jgi:GT2 family glycosyltransferase